MVSFAELAGTMKRSECKVSKKDIAFKRKVDRRIFGRKSVSRKDVLRAMDIFRRMGWDRA